VASHKAFVIPTLALIDGMCEGSDGPTVVADPLLAPYLRATDVRQLTHGFPNKLPRARCDAAMAAVSQLVAAHVDILAGTDALNPMVAHGISLHRELELLVRAGLTPVQALTAATATAAARFGLADRGRIEPGRRADLVLVDGDPAVDIRRTRAIVGVAATVFERDGNITQRDVDDNKYLSNILEQLRQKQLNASQSQLQSRNHSLREKCRVRASIEQRR
jgi:adenine deaminase